MTQAESILSKMLPEWDGDNENLPILSKVQAIEFGMAVAWETMWWYWNELFTDTDDHRNEIRLKQEFTEWYTKELKEDK